MSNYTKTTDFAAKDSLAHGNASKIVKGTEIDTEFNNIASAVNSKLDSSGGTVLAATGSAAAPSYAFSSYTNTGMYAASSNGLGFSLNGTLRLSGTSAGNWTFAAPTSGTALTISGGGMAVTGNSTITGTLGGLTGLTIASGGASITGNSTISGTLGGITGLTVASGGITSSGNVAITSGNVTIAAPSSGNTLALAGITSTNARTVDNTGGATNALYNAFTSTGGSLWVGVDSSVGGVLMSGSAAYSAVFGTTNATAVGIGTNFVQRIGISSTGNVTVNAPSSGTALAITGAANAAGLVVTGSASTPANSIGNSGTAFTVDCSKSNVHYVTMTGNVPAGSMTISNMQDGQTINIYLTQDATGSRTLGNATGVKWPGGTVGVLSTAASAIDCITIQQVNGVKYATILKAFA